MTMHMALRQPLGWLRKKWRFLRSGLWLEAGQYSGDYRRMDRLYLLKDPWQLESDRETRRFELTNAVIASVAPDCDSLLEIGSGEGLQTRHLLKVARHVTGIEVSPTAVGRAIQNVPQADFLVGRAEDCDRIVGTRRFDIATACEILYYAPDVPLILTALQSLSSRVLVTAYERRADKLDTHFTGTGWSRLDDMVAEGTQWRCYLWQAPELTR
jgi:SAM-dependent methyltransferase